MVEKQLFLFLPTETVKILDLNLPYIYKEGNPADFTECLHMYLKRKLCSVSNSDINLWFRPGSKPMVT